MEKIKKIDFSIGIFDEISENIKKRIKQESNNCEIYGIGVYADEIVKNKYNTYPMKNEEERMRIAKNIEDVDFVFLVNSTNVDEIKKIVEKACKERLKK